jgi:hypothetical protein
MNAKPIPSAKGTLEEWLSEEFQQIHESRKNHPHPLGSISLIVLAAGKGEGNAHEPARAPQLKDMETLSTNSAMLVDENSGHGLPLENPQLVTRGVQGVIGASKTSTSVPKSAKNLDWSNSINCRSQRERSLTLTEGLEISIFRQLQAMESCNPLGTT